MSNLKDIESFCARVFSERLSIDACPEVLREFALEFLRLSSGVPDPVDLAKIFENSVALGFFIRQHCAAYERMCRLPGNATASWARREVENGGLTIGLGTTHLAKGERCPLLAEACDHGYRVSGAVPWTSGFGIYDRLVIGFKAPGETVFALVEYPRRSAEGVEVTPRELAALQGTSTVGLRYENFSVPHASVIEVVRPGQKRDIPLTRYGFCDLGIARRACEEIANLAPELGAKREAVVMPVLENLRERITSLYLRAEKETNEAAFDALLIDKDKLISDSVQFLALVAGGRGFARDALPARLIREVQVLSAVLHLPQDFERKCSWYVESPS